MQEVLVDGGELVAQNAIQKFNDFRVTFHSGLSRVM
jgi:hypothetical protein